MLPLLCSRLQPVFLHRQSHRLLEQTRTRIFTQTNAHTDCLALHVAVDQQPLHALDAPLLNVLPERADAVACKCPPQGLGFDPEELCNIFGGSNPPQMLIYPFANLRWIPMPRLEGQFRPCFLLSAFWRQTLPASYRL